MAEVDALIAGSPPMTLAPAERLAAAATQCLLAGGSLVEHLYAKLRETFGRCGPLHLCSVVGQYLFLSVTLNTFDVPVPLQTNDESERPTHFSRRTVSLKFIEWSPRQR